MRSRVYVMLMSGIVTSVLFLAACGGQSTTPTPRGGLSAQAVPNATATATSITLQPGTSIGTNTFADGDTASGGQGQDVDGHGCVAPPLHAIYHIHTHLSIFDQNGNQVMVPWGIGVIPPWTFNTAGDDITWGNCFYHLHTHDRSGVIHDEACCNYNFTLGNFFDVWGMPLSTTDVAGYEGPIWVYMYTPGSGVAGSWSNVIDPRTIVLSEHLEITLSVGRKFSPVPHYRWGY